MLVQILRKPDGGSRGFGFVTYKDEMSVEKCLVMSHSLSGKTVELKRAVKKEDMGGGSVGMGMGSMGMGGGGYGMGGGAGGPMRGNKQPDWMCKDCGNKNFGWREVCNRCQVSKPAAAASFEVSTKHLMHAQTTHLAKLPCLLAVPSWQSCKAMLLHPSIIVVLQMWDTPHAMYLHPQHCIHAVQTVQYCHIAPAKCQALTRALKTAFQALTRAD